MRPTRLRGAREHNLQSVDLDLEPGTLVAIAGPSGAGKSSLAMATLYAEGQRRYVESFSAYARQFLERLARPDVDQLEPVPAAIAVDRRAPVRTSRSTVGTMAELTDYVKELWARCATLSCPGCGRDVVSDSPPTAADAVLSAYPDRRAIVTYALDIADLDQFLTARDQLIAQGYRRAWVRGDTRDLDEVAPTDVLGDGAGAGAPADASSEAGVLYIVTDRVRVTTRRRARLAEALEAAMHRGGGRAQVWAYAPAGSDGHNDGLSFSRALHCAYCDRDFRPPSPGLFSFNSAIGACSTCRGFGRTIGVDIDKVIPDRSLSLAKGAIKAWQGKRAVWERRELKTQCKRARIPFTKPVSQFTESQFAWLMDGDDSWSGIKGWFSWLEGRAYRMHVRIFLSRYRSYDTCPDCRGRRLTERALNWRVGGLHVAEFLALSVTDANAFMAAQARDAESARDPALSLLVSECSHRLQALAHVGLGYLTLDRASRTLSGGEAQRVALTSALGAALAGAMIVLDEPTVGLHPRDVDKLVDVLANLTTGDNIAVVIEHDHGVLRRADRIVELGPGAGDRGGQITFDGTPAKLARARTATGEAMRRPPVAIRPWREPEGWLELRGARGNNLGDGAAGVDIDIPLGAFTCVTGVSGSGKSSLLLETLGRAVRRALGDGGEPPLAFDTLHGEDALSTVIEVDQSPLGRTSRGNLATYVGAWDVVRKRLASTPLARQRGYKPGMFSFNVPGGRCETCSGEGAETVEMQFLADVTFTCADCGGARFAGEVLDVQYRGHNVAEFLQLTTERAARLFADDRALSSRLAPLGAVGLGYMRLGQALSTLSGGEAQRLKLARALSGAPAGALMVLDEPTAGLHTCDVDTLLSVIRTLVESEHTVVVIEHDMRVAAHADYIVDLGPGAGADGGRVVASGPPVAIVQAGTATGRYLAAVLENDEAASTSPARPSPTATGRRRRRNKTSHRTAGHIQIAGAREHNLQNVSLDLPREQLVAITGPSGSGKSTLAFDVLYAEGQRRYLETLSPYARQYMTQLPRPDVDRVAGVPPSVSLEQRTTTGGDNSTVATVTEVAHHLRVLYARAGTLHCPACEVAIEPRTPRALARDIRARWTGGHRTAQVFAPVVRGRKGIHRDLLAQAHERGVAKARIDGMLTDIEPGMKLDRYKEHDIELLIARVSLAAEESHSAREGTPADALIDALTRASEMSDGSVRVCSGKRDVLVSTKRACPSCGRGFGELDPRWLSFNTRQGACNSCEGRGEITRTTGRGKQAREFSETCTACHGTRLSSLARAITVAERPITDILSMSVSRARDALTRWTQPGALAGRAADIGALLVPETIRRLTFLEQVGVGYLQLDRSARTLSGGEMQRVRLAAQLGSGLTGILYVLDEPTIGLHPRDTGRLLSALRDLVQRGNSVIVVEHDADTIRAADHIVDIGPGGGRRGGQVVARGNLRAIARNKRSITGPALSRPAEIPATRRPAGKRGWLDVVGARQHNLNNVRARFPLGALTAVTGVSGSGKTTLTRDVLLRATREALDLTADAPGLHRRIKGFEGLRNAIEIDQDPIGRTPRSVPATYIGIWTHIRKLLASTPDARARGYGPARFSFNVAEGRCDTCAGQGSLTVEMSFLPNVLMPCDACGGLRFSPETLDITWRGYNAGQILRLHVADAVDVFGAVRKVVEPLRLLADLGLDYLQLGQPSNTLSGGEAQRLKLVSELGARARGRTLYVMDEPTTGLHRDDVARLLGVMQRLVDRGDTVIVIEHHPDVMLAADWIIDLGPEGGEAGGNIVIAGTPETVAACANSHTGAVLVRELANG